MRIDLSNITGIYIANGNTDMRLSIDGLAAKVQQDFELDPFSSNIFLFSNRMRDKVKILHWEHNGFWLYYRRLENGHFRWPEGPDTQASSIDPRQLRWLLEGLTLEDGKVFPKINPKKVV